MQRRQFLKVGVASAAIGLGGASVMWLNQGKDTKLLNLSALLSILNKMSSLPPEQLANLSTGHWNTAQVFGHCAQSVEFSMTGFPQHKSPYLSTRLAH
jgi:hypothetical protein